jgi:hypothetical protein
MIIFERVELVAENAVASYIHREHDMCILTLSYRGQLNRVSEQASVLYGPRLEPGSETSKKAEKKRKNDTSAGPMRKWAMVSGKKAAAPKLPVEPNGVGAASSKTSSTHTKTALKAGAPPRAGVPLKATVPKTVVTQAAPKAGVLRISTGVKRPSSAEPSLVPGRKQAKESMAPSPTSVPVRKVAGLSQPTTESGDGRVVACVMLVAPFVVSSSSSSLSESSA